MITGIPAVDIVIVTAAVLTALGVVWRSVLRPIIRSAEKAQEVLPVLLDIAKEFKSNNGSSLRDSLDALAHDARDLSDYAHTFKHDFVNRFTVLVGNQDLMAEQLDALSQEVALVKTDIANVKAIIDRRNKPR